jgi:hypothetical protein
MPEYGVLPAEAGQGLLPWPWARTRLEQSRNYWFSVVRPTGRPHATAVWGLWLDDVFYVSTGRISVKSRALAQNPACVVTTENAIEAVIVEGAAALVTAAQHLRRIDRAYVAKYGSSYPADSNVFGVTPHVVFGFIEHEPEFTGSATRWEFRNQEV